MSAIGDVRPPEVKPTEQTTTLATLNDEAKKRPTMLAEAMERPDAPMMNRPNTLSVPLPPEAPQPMSPDNGQAVARAMQMLITVNVQTTQALVLTELKPAATQDSKQHDYKREHRSTRHAELLLPVADEDEDEDPDASKRRRRARPDENEADAENLAEDEEAASVLELIELLKRSEPLQPATLARVHRFLESGAAALVTSAPTRFRIPFRI